MSNDLPAKPEALRFLALQKRGVVAIGKNTGVTEAESQGLGTSAGDNHSPTFDTNRRGRPNQTPGTVKLLLPPRQSRGDLSLPIGYWRMAYQRPDPVQGPVVKIPNRQTSADVGS